MQDYDYMNVCSQRATDPFLATGENFVDGRVLRRAMESVPKSFRKTKFPLADSIRQWKGNEDSSPIGGTRNETIKASEFKSFQKRLWIAAFAGTFLLAPMWLMVLHHTLYTALVSTTVFVTVFGFIMAWSLEKESDVLSSTAVYAAVLVVFVGINTHF
jgi:hypothetical protein